MHSLDAGLGRRGDVRLIHFQEYALNRGRPHFARPQEPGASPGVCGAPDIKGHYSKFFMHEMIRDFSFRSAWRVCDALLVHSDGLRAALSRFLAGKHPPIHVTPHGVWHGESGPMPKACPKRTTRDRLLFFGVIRPNKGVHILLEALERLPGCDLTIAGGAEVPSYLERIRRLVRRFPPGRVELIDRYVSEDEATDLFRRSRLVILPYTRFTSQSGVLHMALAHGRPVVATEVGALGECVRGWRIGQVVPPGDGRGLAEAIELLLDPERHDAAIAAIARVRGELTWTKMAEATIDVYRSIVT